MHTYTVRRNRVRILGWEDGHQLLLWLPGFNYLCPGSSEVPRNPLTRWDVSSIPANGIFLTKKLKNKNKNVRRVEND